MGFIIHIYIIQKVETTFWKWHGIYTVYNIYIYVCYMYTYIFLDLMGDGF